MSTLPSSKGDITVLTLDPKLRYPLEMAHSAPSSAPLALTHTRLGIAAALPLLGLTLFALGQARRDPIEFMATWVPLSAILATPTAILHAWLLARSERRLVTTRHSRAWYLPLAMSNAIMATWVPLGIAGPLLMVWSLVFGPGRWFGGGVVLCGAWVVVAMAFGGRAWSLASLAARAPLPASHARWTTWGDLVPTSVLSMAAAAWGAMLLLPVFEDLLLDLSTGMGMVMVMAWLGVAGGVALAARAQAPFEGIDQSFARTELAGGIALGLLAPLFLLTLDHHNDDLKWFGILLSSVALLAATASWSVGRALRRDVWMPGT